MNYTKIVESPHYHIWTDALHARELAKQANNKWDRGTYVRWTVITSWIVLEIACQNALNDSEISYRFKENLDRALDRNGYDNLEWGHGIWQRVRELQERRKDFVHRFVAEDNYFPDSNLANEAIEIVRKAVSDIYNHVNRPVPTWIRDDDDRGWDSGNESHATLTVVHSGADKNNPKAIKIYFEYQGEEKLSDILPEGSEYMPYVNDLKDNLNVPASKIKVYQDENLIHEEELNIRGAE